TAGYYDPRVRITRKNGTSVLADMKAFRVVQPDSHSWVRLHAELAVANRGRSISFAIALTPVRKAFFEKGVWHCGWNTLNILCGINPFIMLRLTGDSSTIAELGAGLAIFINSYFAINGGFLAGTKDISSGWRIEEKWFVGAAIDPLLLAETIAAQ